MKEWWSGLQEREQLILLVTAIIIVALVLYLFIYEPILKKQQTLTQRIESQRQLVTWMQDASAKIRQLQGNSKQSSAAVDSNTSLVSIIERSARQANLRNPIQRMEPAGNDAVKLWIDDAPFDAVIEWLGSLERQYKVQVARASINKSDKTGLVDLQLSLNRS